MNNHYYYINAFTCYWNYFKSVTQFAEQRHISLHQAKVIINKGRILYNDERLS